MAWTIDSVTQREGDNLYINWSGIADASDLTDQAVLDISTLAAPNTSTEILNLQISAGGVIANLEWDATTDDLIVTCPPGCTINIPGEVPLPRAAPTVYVDPKSTGTTGDILLTTLGGAAGDGVSIQMWLRIF